MHAAYLRYHYTLRDADGTALKSKSGHKKVRHVRWTFRTEGCPYQATHLNREAAVEAAWAYFGGRANFMRSQDVH